MKYCCKKFEEGVNRHLFWYRTGPGMVFSDSIRSYWEIDADSMGGTTQEEIYYCPLCGKKLK